MTIPVKVTDRTFARLAEIAADGAPKALRVAVLGGGCSGFQYKFDLVPHAEPGDIVLERSGAKIVIDSVSLGFLAGSEIDFVDDLIGASFRIHNPKATQSCGCGTSFSI
ncbi:MAG: iron-sulfur cluster assembly accessory protein [Hyphomicrobiaceae bacterium]|nr:iron-sulfur cluster assembly accessory protein [Hyphomicrobiaceae bacterium]